VKLRDLEDVTTRRQFPPDSRRVCIAEHRAQRTNGTVEVVKEEASKVTGVEFMVLHEGRIVFLGNASELLSGTDPYLVEYLYKTLPPW
jgi:hypothetical protein